MGRIGGLVMIVRRSLRQHALSTCVTVLSVALASGLTMAVFALSTQTRQAFTGGPVGFDAVLGARGSQLQLVLNTVFHLETSPGNVPWSLYQQVKSDRSVALAIPYAVGDNYYGYRIVGTTQELFTKFEYQKGKKFQILRGGRYFDNELREAVIGYTVAMKLGLKTGDKINPYHGLSFDPAAKHQEEYLVVGVMAPTNSPSDKVVWIPIEGVFRMENHVLRASGKAYTAKAGVEIPDEHKEVSAVMIKFRNPMSAMMYEQRINKQGKVATLAWPIASVMADLFSKIGWVTKVLELVAYLVVLVAAASILASIYNTMNERRREFAILRSLGARRRTVFGVIVLEATAIAAMGSVVGWGVYLAILALARAVIQRETGVVLELTQMHPVLWIAPLGMTALGALSGMLPAVKAYSTDVAANLVPTS